MKKIINLIAAFFLIPLALFAAKKPYWKDLNVYSINANTERTELIFWSKADDALKKNFEASENYLSLNGLWKFQYFSSQENMDAEVAQTTSEEAEEWTDIKVPGNWEVQGFGIPIYVNFRYEFMPWEPKPPHIPDETPTGVYFRTFEIPQEWEGRQVYLNLCGAKSGVYVYINGKEVGYNENSKDLARFNISPFLQPEKNNLLLKIYRYSTGSYLDCIDFFRISGVERDVYLSSEKRDTDFDINLISTLEDNLQNGVFRLEISANPDYDIDFSYQLLDNDGEILLRNSCLITEGKAVMEGRVENVRKWSAETPELYTLLMSVDGEYTRFNVGFRRLEIVNNLFLVNGKPIKFKGVNLHETDPYTGHYVNRERMLEDLRIMKEHNINAIRTSHYPQQRMFYDLCDSLGFYVYNEANIESHGMFYDPKTTLGNQPKWYGNHIYRIRSMYYRTRNYACVTILSLGNEGGNGYNFYKAYNELKALEKGGMNRPVCYERAEWDWNTDMIVPQYPSASWFKRIGENPPNRPVCPSEYAHAMGNSTGSIDLQWEEIYKYPHLQGGFIWEWVDHALAKLDDKGKFLFWAYGGDFGEKMPSDGNFVCDGLIGPNRKPHPGLSEVKYVYQDIKFSSENPTEGKFNIFNRFYFKDLSKYKVVYSIFTDRKLVKKGSLSFNTPPQEGEDFEIKLPRLRKRRAYYIDFDVLTTEATPLLKKGHVIASEQFLIKEAKHRAYKPRKANFRLKEDENFITMKTSKVELTYDKAKGYVSSYKVNSKEVLADTFGLRPLFWRAPNDNDYGNGWPKRTQAFKTASKEFHAIAKAEHIFDRAELTVTYTLPTGNIYNVKYRLYANGIMTIFAGFEGIKTKKPVEVPRIGFRWRLPASADRFEYFGRGPHENYWDRKAGARMGKWRTSASEAYHPYIRPQENGHRTDCKWLQIGSISLVASTEFEFNALRNSVEDFDSEEATFCDYQWPNSRPDEEQDSEKAKDVLRRQHHSADIVSRDYVELCIDYHQTGVGGYNSWGAVPEKEKTLWNNSDYEFSFTIVPRGVFWIRKPWTYKY